MPAFKYSAAIKTLIDQARSEYQDAWGDLSIHDLQVPCAIPYKRTSKRTDWFIIGEDKLVRLGNSSNSGSRTDQAREAWNNGRLAPNRGAFVYLKRPATPFHIPDPVATQLKQAIQAEHALEADHRFKLIEKNTRLACFNRLERFLNPTALKASENALKQNMFTQSAKDLYVYSYNACAGASNLAGTCRDIPLAQRAENRTNAILTFTEFADWLLEEPNLVDQIDRGVPAIAVLAQRFNVSKPVIESTQFIRDWTARKISINHDFRNGLIEALSFLNNKPESWIPRNGEDWKKLSGCINFMYHRGMNAIDKAAEFDRLDQLERDLMPYKYREL